MTGPEGDREGEWPGVQPSLRVIRMVSELHRLGFEKARIMPYEYPIAYRIAVGPAEICSPRNGAWVSAGHDQYALYSSAQGNACFGWDDAEADSAHALADKFVERFPAIVERCAGRDPAYARWLEALLGVLERNPGRLPSVMAEYMEPWGEDLRVLPLRLFWCGAAPGNAGDMSFDLPPPPAA
jgi:hypothetical protein